MAVEGAAGSQRHLWASSPPGSQVPSSKNARKQSENRQKIEIQSWSGRKLLAPRPCPGPPLSPHLTRLCDCFLFAGVSRPKDWATGSTSSACHSSGAEGRESGMQSAPACHRVPFPQRVGRVGISLSHYPIGMRVFLKVIYNNGSIFKVLNELNTGNL